MVFSIFFRFRLVYFPTLTALVSDWSKLTSRKILCNNHYAESVLQRTGTVSCFRVKNQVIFDRKVGGRTRPRVCACGVVPGDGKAMKNSTRRSIDDSTAEA